MNLKVEAGADEDELIAQQEQKEADEAGPFAGCLATLKALEKKNSTLETVMEELEEAEAEAFREMMMAAYRSAGF